MSKPIMPYDRILTELLAILPLIAIFLLASCAGPKREAPVAKEPPQSLVQHPAWSRNANIYEVNVRQYTPEGTLKAFEAHIPRLKEMGVDILWLMPIFPIGEKNRKGTLGSYYSISDYVAVNPEFGTLEDLKDVVKIAHDNGMYVILDWVANHTAWDHHWIEEHPDWYKKDSLGHMFSPYDWTDVVQLDYDNKELWQGMIDAMKFWVAEAGIDGYRCDVAYMVPVEFWNLCRQELDKIKPVFMLAEAEEPTHHHKAFDMSYAWELHHLMNEIAQGKKNALDLETYFMKQDTLFPEDAYRMNFITNHDENSWKGSEFERMGPAVLTMAVLAHTLPGMPLIYTGQESALTKRLEFFEKDMVDWGSYEMAPFYKTLLDIKHRNQALWNGTWGGELQRIPTGSDSTLFFYFREKEGDAIFVLTNLSDKIQEGKLKGDRYLGNYYELFSREEKAFAKNDVIRLKPWEQRIYVRK
jgi:glycosidase